MRPQAILSGLCAVPVNKRKSVEWLHITSRQNEGMQLDHIARSRKFAPPHKAGQIDRRDGQSLERESLVRSAIIVHLLCSKFVLERCHSIHTAELLALQITGT